LEARQADWEWFVNIMTLCSPPPAVSAEAVGEGGRSGGEGRRKPLHAIGIRSAARGEVTPGGPAPQSNGGDDVIEGEVRE